MSADLAADKPADAPADTPAVTPPGMLLTSSVCPQGGFHEFEPVKGEADFWAGLGAGVCSASLCCLWWPLLLCAPACYFGGKEIGKDFANKKCEKCGLEVDRRGQMQKAPNAVPATNPSSGQPNAFYGWQANKSD